MRFFDWGNPDREFRCVAFDPTGTLLAAGGGNKATIVWDVETGEERARFRDIAQALQFDPSGARLVIETKTALRLGDVRTGATTSVSPADRYAKIPVFAPSGDWSAYSHTLESGGETLTGVSRFGQADQSTLWNLSLGAYGLSVYLACLPNPAHFMTAEYRTGPNHERSRRVDLRSRADGSVLRSWTGDVFGYGDRLFGSPSCGSVVVQNGMWLRAHDIDEMNIAPRVIRNDNRKHFTGIAFHPSGRYLAATSNDATVKLYDTTTWAVAKAYTWDVGRMRSVAFSPDGTLAAAGSDTGKVVVWDVDV